MVLPSRFLPNLDGQQVLIVFLLIPNFSNKHNKPTNTHIMKSTMSLEQQLAEIDISDASKLGLTPIEEGEVILGYFSGRLIRLCHLRNNRIDGMSLLIKELKDKGLKHDVAHKAGNCTSKDCDAFYEEVDPLIKKIGAQESVIKHLNNIFWSELKLNHCDPEEEYGGNFGIREGYAFVVQKSESPPRSGDLLAAVTRLLEGLRGN
jgi:hypothetical protein